MLELGSARGRRGRWSSPLIEPTTRFTSVDRSARGGRLDNDPTAAMRALFAEHSQELIARPTKARFDEVLAGAQPEVRGPGPETGWIRELVDPAGAA